MGLIRQACRVEVNRMSVLGRKSRQAKKINPESESDNFEKSDGDYSSVNSSLLSDDEKKGKKRKRPKILLEEGEGEDDVTLKKNNQKSDLDVYNSKKNVQISEPTSANQSRLGSASN